MPGEERGPVVTVVMLVASGLLLIVLLRAGAAIPRARRRRRRPWGAYLMWCVGYWLAPDDEPQRARR